MNHPWNSQSFAQGAHAAGRSPEVVHAAEVTARQIKRINPNLPVILTLAHLGHVVDVAPETLRRVSPARMIHTVSFA
jgi:hypothetical protein